MRGCSGTAGFRRQRVLTTRRGRGRLTSDSGTIDAVTSASGPSASSSSRSKAGGRSRSEQLRLLLAGLLGGLAVAFALLNTDHVEVDWLLGSWSTPLIVVIVVSLLAGALLGFTLAKRAGRSSGRAAARAPAEHRG
ncbi:MAG TPA: LapA family protein [Solirubrobacteraceae bacterium]